MIALQLSKSTHMPARRSILRMAEGTQHDLWLGTLGFGLQHFDTKTAQFTTFASSDTSGSLSDSEVNWVHVARTGAVWVATLNGLNEFDPATKHFTVYDSRDGLASSAVDCVLEDTRGKLWMNTDKGISSFDPTDQDLPQLLHGRRSSRPRDGWCRRLPAHRERADVFFRIQWSDDVPS